MLLALGYAFGNGGYGVWIARVTGASAALAGGIVLYIMASDLAAVSLVATLSPRLGGMAVPDGLGTATLAVAAVMLGFIVFGPYQFRQAARRGPFSIRGAGCPASEGSPRS